VTTVCTETTPHYILYVTGIDSPTFCGVGGKLCRNLNWSIQSLPLNQPPGLPQIARKVEGKVEIHWSCLQQTSPISSAQRGVRSLEEGLILGYDMEAVRLDCLEVQKAAPDVHVLSEERCEWWSKGRVGEMKGAVNNCRRRGHHYPEIVVRRSFWRSTLHPRRHIMKGNEFACNGGMNTCTFMLKGGRT